jgi:hypothetical protein
VVKSTSSLGKETESTAIYEIKTKEEIKQEVMDEFNTAAAAPFSTAALTTGSISDYSKAYLDFEKAQFLGTEIEKLSSGSMTYSLYSINIKIDYKAVFPDRITNARVGDEQVKFSGKQIKFDMDTLGELPEGALMVTTEKELSPLGVFTWVVAGIIIIAVIAGIFMMRRKPADTVQ